MSLAAWGSALGLLAALFGVLTWLVQTGGAVVRMDGLAQAWLEQARVRPLLVLFGWLTQAGTGGTGAIVALVSSALLWSSGRGALAGPLWLAFLGAEATTWPLKFLTARLRPPFLEGMTAASPSYPSAHATVSVAVYGFLTLAIAGQAPAQAGLIWTVGVLLVLLICASRPLLSLHYVSDVAGGMLVGGFWLLLAWRFARPA